MRLGAPGPGGPAASLDPEEILDLGADGFRARFFGVVDLAGDARAASHGTPPPPSAAVAPR